MALNELIKVATPASTATGVATVRDPAFDLRVDNEADHGTVSTGDPLIWTATVTNASTGSEGQVRYYRLRLRLVRKGERWLTSNVQFVR